MKINLLYLAVGRLTRRIIRRSRAAILVGLPKSATFDLFAQADAEISVQGDPNELGALAYSVVAYLAQESGEECLDYFLTYYVSAIHATCAMPSERE